MTHSKFSLPSAFLGDLCAFAPLRLCGEKLFFFVPERNLILMDDGLTAPIDLRVQALSGALLDTVAKPCQCP